MQYDDDYLDGYSDEEDVLLNEDKGKRNESFQESEEIESDPDGAAHLEEITREKRDIKGAKELPHPFPPYSLYLNKY